MSKADRLLNRMRASKAGWKFDDLERLYLGFGFEKYEGSKHTLYIHPDFPELRATVTRHRSLPIGYVQHAVAVIDKLKELKGGRKNG